MTAKEMAHWERWHRLGQRRFQWTHTLFLFVAIGLSPSLFELLRGEFPEWVKNILISGVVSVPAFFLNGRIWKMQVAEYQRHNPASRDNRT
jgi:hypothetical protein